MPTAVKHSSHTIPRPRPVAAKPVPPLFSTTVASDADNVLATQTQPTPLAGQMPAMERQYGRLAQAIYQFDRYFRLPDSPRSFGIFLIALMLVVAGMVVQVLLSAQILQAEARLQTIQKQYQVLQQQNSEFIWQIARETNLQRAQARVADLGYRPVTTYNYVVLPGKEIVTEHPTAGTPVALPDAASTQAHKPTAALTAKEQMNLHVETEAAPEPVVPDEAPTALVSNPQAPPIEGWMAFLFPAIDKPQIAIQQSDPLLESPAEWWNQIWKQSQNRATSALESIQVWLPGG